MTGGEVVGRISAERTAKAQEQLKSISPEDNAKVKAIANIFRPLRSFISKTPRDYGITGWRFSPSRQKITLRSKPGISRPRVARATSSFFNHALPVCRAGFPGHFGEPWGNCDGVEIDFVIQYKHLTDAGYNDAAADDPSSERLLDQEPRRCTEEDLRSVGKQGEGDDLG